MPVLDPINSALYTKLRNIITLPVLKNVLLGVCVCVYGGVGGGGGQAGGGIRAFERFHRLSNILTGRKNDFLVAIMYIKPLRSKYLTVSCT